jgi:hypothetical protein
MRKFLISLMALLFCTHAWATVFYVNVSNTVPISPFTNWVTAATNIQDAVDVATNGDLVLVTDGVYQFGGRSIRQFTSPYLTNRVAVTKPLTVQSINGAAVTVIQGAQTVASTNGASSIRCAYLTDGASLIGFTLTNGATRAFSISYDVVLDLSGGGLLCASTNAFVNNCVFIGNSAAEYAGGVYSGTLSNCIIIANSAFIDAGGAKSNVLINCVISSNSYAGSGTAGGAAGGVFGATLNGCTINYNRSGASGFGGIGIVRCIANNCIIYSNNLNNTSPTSGGGASFSTLSNCIVFGNIGGSGAGTANCSVRNSLIYGNSFNVSSGLGGGSANDTLIDCTVSNNVAAGGGGTSSSIMTNCLIIGNVAKTGSGGGSQNGTSVRCIYINNHAASQGGATAGTSAYNCLIISNTANLGGGVNGGLAYNCTIAGNFATNSGGGAYQVSFLKNSILYYNAAAKGINFFSSSTIVNCCTTPYTNGVNGIGGITNEPAFVNLAGGDFHLQSNSPCINAGNNAYVLVTNDLDGNARIVAGTADIGAYEYQTPSSILSYAWAQQFGLPTDGSADYADADGDNANNWQEWIADTNPTNVLSVLQMTSLTNDVSGMIVNWQSVSTRTYYLQRSTNLFPQSAFSSIQSNIVGQVGITSFTDTTATNGGPYFYRVGVQ